MGLLSPNPAIRSLAAATPLSMSHALTAAARLSERGWLMALLPWLSVWPSMTKFTPGGGVELADIFGREESLRRIREGIELLEKAVSLVSV